MLICDYGPAPARLCRLYGFSFQDPSVRQLLKLANHVRGLRDRRRDSGHIAVLRRPPSHSIPSAAEVEAKLASMGFSHVFWSWSDDFEDQLAFLSELCFRISGRRTASSSSGTQPRTNGP